MTRVRRKAMLQPAPKADGAQAAPSSAAPGAADDRLTEAFAKALRAPAPGPMPASGSGVTISIERPRGKTKLLLDELQRMADDGMTLEEHMQQLMSRGRMTDALRVITFLDTGANAGFEIYRAAVLAALGRREDADAALASRGEATWTKYLEASQFVGEHAVSAALTLVQKAVALEPNAPPALLHQAYLQYASNHCRDALSTLNRLASMQTLAMPAQTLRIDCALREGDAEGMLDEARQLAADYPAIGDLQAMLACLHTRVGDYDAARDVCEQLAEAPMATRSGVRHFIDAACKIGDAAIFEKVHRQMLATRYAEADACIALTHAHARRGDLTSALGVTQTAEKYTDRPREIYRLQGQILDALNQPGDAARAYAKAVDPARADQALSLLHARALWAAGELKEAAAAFRAILATSPSNLPALRGAIAVATARKTHPRDLVAMLWTAHSVEPDDLAFAQAFVTAAEAECNRTYRRRALTTLERLHAQDPGASTWRTHLARALRQSDPERALSLARGVLQDSPDDAQAQAVCESTCEALRKSARIRDFTLKAVPLPGAAKPAAPPVRVTYSDGGSQVSGIDVGRTHENRTAVRCDDGEVVWAPWGLCGGDFALGAVAKLKAGMAYAVPCGIVKCFDALLARSVVASATVADFCAKIGTRGEAFLSGGAVRDIIADPHHAQPRDIDLAATLPPALVRLICGSLAGNAKGLQNRPNGVVSPYAMEYFGLLKYGTMNDADETINAMLDVMSLRTCGAHAPVQAVRGARHPVKPVAFGADLHADALSRDFTCNALYYDPSTCLLLDPTGVGKPDATLRRLQLCSIDSVCKNESLGWRYVKMREMGYTPTERTRAAVASHFAHYISLPDAEVWLARTFERVFSDVAGSVNPKARVDAMIALLQKDGIGDEKLFDAMRRHHRTHLFSGPRAV